MQSSERERDGDPESRGHEWDRIAACAPHSDGSRTWPRSLAGDPRSHGEAAAGRGHNKIRPITISAGWMEMEMEMENGNGNGGMGMHPSLSLYLWHIKLLNQSPRRSPRRRRRRRSSTAGQTNRSTYTESEINDNC